MTQNKTPPKVPTEKEAGFTPIDNLFFLPEKEITNKNTPLAEKKYYTKKDGLFKKLRVHALDKHKVFKEEDVRSAVRRLKEELTDDEWLKIEGDVDFAEFRDMKIKEIFGKPLTDGGEDK